MQIKLRFHKHYFLWTCILFAIELFIALYIHDKIIRPYIGDVLVVILIYCFFKTFFKLPTLPLAIGVLVFACIIETLQYLNFLKLIGLENNRIAAVLIGNSFAWTDIGAYIAGIGIVLWMEYKFTSSKRNKFFN